MKVQLRSHVAAFFLLGPAAIALSALPSTVAAQVATPEVYSIQIASDGGLEPGARLQFTVQGTPYGQASLRIRGARDAVALSETSRGVYTGRYIISRNDHIDADSTIRAILRRENLSVAANYNFPPDIANVAIGPRPGSMRIERFSMAPISRIEPGAELHFVVDGMPGAAASVVLPGLAQNVLLAETRPGHYEGSYVLRRRDNLTPDPVMATLRSGDRVVTANLGHPLVSVVPAEVPIHILSHSNNGQVDGSFTRIRGRTAPYASVDVKVDAVPPVVVGQFGVARRVFTQTLQADADGRFEFSFSPPFPVPGTRYELDMTASKADVTNEARLVLYQRQG
jgi:hypothetical protein